MLRAIPAFQMLECIGQLQLISCKWFCFALYSCESGNMHIFCEYLSEVIVNSGPKILLFGDKMDETAHTTQKICSLYLLESINLLAPQSGALIISAYRDFLPNPIQSTYSFQAFKPFYCDQKQCKQT